MCVCRFVLYSLCSKDKALEGLSREDIGRHQFMWALQCQQKGDGAAEMIHNELRMWFSIIDGVDDINLNIHLNIHLGYK